MRVISRDLESYRRVAEETLINFHREKIDEINKCISETWSSICYGDDINKIYITSDELLTNKSYRYRIVMETKR